MDSPFYSHLIRWENTAQIKNFFSDDLRKEIGQNGSLPLRLNSGLPPDFMSWDPLSRAQYTEISIFLSNYLLSSQGDRMAMAHSVEGRFPFLDYRVVEFACRIPPRYRLNGLKEKFILRQAARKIIPPELADRPKRPYRAPISRCFLGDGAPEYVRDLLSEGRIKKYGYFNPAKVTRLIEKGNRQKGFLLSERENMALVGILSTQLVHEQFIEHFPARPREPVDFKLQISNIKLQNGIQKNP